MAEQVGRGSTGQLWEKALVDHKVYAGSFDPSFWRTYFEAHPEVLHHILHDLHQVAGTDKGRPPTLDDLWEMVAPKFSEKSFAGAFMDALGDRSIRAVAAAVGLDHGAICRYVNGTYDIVKVHDPAGSMRRLELVAKGLGVRPSYFAEWRRLWIMSVIDSAMADKPNVSVGIYRKFSSQEPGPRAQDAHLNGR